MGISIFCWGKCVSESPPVKRLLYFWKIFSKRLSRWKSESESATKAWKCKAEENFESVSEKIPSTKTKSSLPGTRKEDGIDSNFEDPSMVSKSGSDRIRLISKVHLADFTEVYFHDSIWCRWSPCTLSSARLAGLAEFRQRIRSETRLFFQQILISSYWILQQPIVAAFFKLKSQTSITFVSMIFPLARTCTKSGLI